VIVVVVVVVVVVIVWFFLFCWLHYEKKEGGGDVLQLTLQPTFSNFWVASNNYNSPYLYVVSVIQQVARVAIHYIYSATHYNLITTLSQQFIFNYYATPLWLQS
jgi:hypothetical protein